MNRYSEIINIEFLPGTDIKEAAKDAVKLARERDVIVRFDFNLVEMDVYSWMTSEEVAKEWQEEIKRKIPKSD